MPATLEELDRRLSALERTQNDTTESLRWVVAKLGRLAAVQDEHTLRFERLETKVDHLETKVDHLGAKVDRIEVDLRSLRDTLPGLMRDVMREVLAERDRR